MQFIKVVVFSIWQAKLVEICEEDERTQINLKSFKKEPQFSFGNHYANNKQYGYVDTLMMPEKQY